MESAGDSGSERGVLPRRALRPQTRAGGVRCAAGAARASGPPRARKALASPVLVVLSSLFWKLGAPNIT